MVKDCTGRVVTRAAETEADYARRFLALQQAARRDGFYFGIEQVITWFGTRHDCWAENTIRQYRAAIRYVMERDMPDGRDRAMLAERLNKGPLPRIGGRKQTSARKRKSLGRDDFLLLMRHLEVSTRADDRLIRGLLAFGVALFLRPVEYLGAYLVGNMLFVPNAKATNGRANGETRERSLDNMTPKTKASLVKFLHHFDEAAAAAGSWKKFHNRLSSRLARICAALGIRRVSFYTLRHVGMATAKTWMTSREVAAAAGHASIRTATSHYAKRRSGWHGLKLAGKPSANSMARVRGEAKIFRARDTPSMTL
jgi:integrase